MADALETAHALLRELELRLRELIGEATASGQYEQVSQLAILTNMVGSILSGTPSRPSAVGTGWPVEDGTPLGGSTKRPRSPGRKVSSRAAEYPFFHREGDTLVKVGWSRSTKSEYSHRVPKSGVDALVRYLASRRSNQFPISVETMTDALKSDTQAGILGYQVYVAVAWLKEEGWLVANGRHGYTLLRAKGLTPERFVEDMWDRLPTDSAS